VAISDVSHFSNRTGLVNSIALTDYHRWRAQYIRS